MNPTCPFENSCHKEMSIESLQKKKKKSLETLYLDTLYSFNQLTDYIILDWSKLKQFANGILKRI